MEVSACLVSDERVVGVFSEAPHCLHGMLLQSVGLTDSTQASCDASVDNWVNVTDSQVATIAQFLHY